MCECACVPVMRVRGAWVSVYVCLSCACAVHGTVERSPLYSRCRTCAPRVHGGRILHALSHSQRRATRLHSWASSLAHAHVTCACACACYMCMCMCMLHVHVHVHVRGTLVARKAAAAARSSPASSAASRIVACFDAEWPREPCVKWRRESACTYLRHVRVRVRAAGACHAHVHVPSGRGLTPLASPASPPRAAAVGSRWAGG